MRFALALTCVLSASITISAAPVDFVRDVRPLLSNSCFTCHGPDEKARKADLQLDLREPAVKLEAIVPGKPDESELIRRLTTDDPELRMPPGKSKKPMLSKDQIELLKRWIAEGANYSEHWAFTKVTRPAVPTVRDSKWVRNPVDAFVLAKLESTGFAPSKEADRVTLIRRLSFDLTGLPPSPEEVQAFVKDASSEAYEKVVDRLLASRHYGERMAVWWLDLVRYADTIGYHSDNPMNVAPYRDYVIESFNENKPFDTFTVEQIAGDLLKDPTREQKVATAYNRLLQTTEEGGAQAKEYEVKYASDRVRNYAQVWLGATLMCAECHNHKFDPYTQKDFYSVAAFFADVQEASVGRREPGMPLVGPEQEKQLAKLDDAVEAAWKPFAAAMESFKKEKALTAGKNAVLVKGPLGRKDDSAVKALATFVKEKAPKAKAEWAAVEAALKAKSDFEADIQRVIITTAGPPRTVRILPRGNWMDNTGQVVAPGTPEFLPPLAKTAGRPTRLDLAKWTVASDNPLTSRVAANRLWKLFFGRGLSRSLEESGTQADPPSHSELLDWLASEFRQGWDIKRFVKLVVTSNAYRQSSLESAEAREKDPLNRLLSHQNRYRLDAEFVRDSALAISGLLVRDIGGPSVKPYQPAGYWSSLNFPTREWQMDSGAKVYRRGMYTHLQRTFPHPAMIAFDAPSREECTCERPRSNIPQQALVLLNDPEFVEAAKVLAEKTLAATQFSDGARIDWMFERATGREPVLHEVKILFDLLEKHRKDGDQIAAWSSVARVVLNLHETMTRE